LPDKNLNQTGPSQAKLNKLGGLLTGGLLLELALILLFYNLAKNTLNQDLAFFDQTVTGAITSWRSPVLTIVFTAITGLGSATAIIFLTFLTAWRLIFYLRQRWDAIIFSIAVGGALLINHILKLSFHRIRPAPPTLASAYGFSFPSGHAMDSLVLYGMLLYLVWINFKPGIKTLCFSIFVPLLVMGVGISRIYLGVHYPSDVLAGYLAGGIWLIGCVLGLHTVRRLN